MPQAMNKKRSMVIQEKWKLQFVWLLTPNGKCISFLETMLQYLRYVPGSDYLRSKTNASPTKWERVSPSMTVGADRPCIHLKTRHQTLLGNSSQPWNPCNHSNPPHSDERFDAPDFTRWNTQRLLSWANAPHDMPVSWVKQMWKHTRSNNKCFWENCIACHRHEGVRTNVEFVSQSMATWTPVALSTGCHLNISS